MPTRGLINPELLTDIADAIRAKNGTRAGMTPAQMAEAISNLELSEAIKQALLNCFAHVAWIDDQGQTYYDALEDALYPTAPPAELLSISAVFEQGQTVIYDTDSLDDLKPMLTVTAHYTDGTSAEITTYTLSGTLEEGTSTITVSYGGKTATFDVTVSGDAPLWESTNESFTGGYLSTLQPICNADRDFTVAIDITLNTNPTSGNASTYRLPRIIANGTSTYALAVYKNTASSSKLSFMYMSQPYVSIGKTDAGRHRFVITHTAGSGVATMQYRYENDATETVSVTAAHTDATANVIIGQSSGANQLPPGTLNHGLIYDIVWEQSEIDAFLGVTEGGE